LVAAFALEAHHHVDHVFQHARAGDRTVLDMAHQHQRDAVLLGIANQFERTAAHLADRAWRAFDLVRMHRLDRSITSSAGGFMPPSVVRMSRTEVLDASRIGALPNPSRSARRRTWSDASSPLI
jgi:hypothetical protein